MINKRYRLTEPYVIEEFFFEEKLSDEKILIKPTKMGICHADQRYYQGNRDKGVLKQKLPMCLIHEAIGEVIYDPLKEFAVGEKVVMIPNSPKEENNLIKENYLRTSKFRSSGIDGYMQEYVNIRRNRVIRVDELDDDASVLLELISVSYHAITRMAERKNMDKVNTIGIWGNGSIGYILSGLLHIMYPNIKVSIIGRSSDKNLYFTTVDSAYTIDKLDETLTFDCAFECVGGNQSEVAINQIIDYINPEGVISALGVSEELERINMRMVLEKGLTIFGSSRSGYEDFDESIKVLKDNPELQKYLKHLINETFEINSINDIDKAFNYDQNKRWGKTVMYWNL